VPRAPARPPFGKGDVSATMLRVLEGDPDLAGLHPMVADALAGGLSPDPDERPSPSLIVADLMSAVGWAPGELDYVTVNWAQLLDTGMRTQMVSSDPQEIAAPPEWEDAGQRPGASGARAVSYPQHPRRDASEFTAANDHTDVVDTASVAEGYGDWGDDAEEVAWHDDATDTWQVVDDADPTEVMAPYPQPDYQGFQGGYVDPRGGGADPGAVPGYGQQPSPQPGVAASPMGVGQQWDPGQTAVGAQGESASSLAKKTAWISSAALLALLAALPFLLGMSGTLIVGIALTAFGLVGAMGRWLERRRILRGPKASDGAAVIAMSPILLVRSVLTTALGLVVGGLVPYAIWAFVSYAHEERVLWSWPVDIATATSLDRDDYWLGDPRGTIIVWALASVTLLAAWLMPFAADLRVGMATSLRVIVRPAWGRALLAVGCGGFLAGAWLIITGGLAH